jgi:hypothetical protein
MANISGIVIDRQTNKPCQDVSVRLGRKTDSTNRRGEYSLSNIHQGTYIIYFTKKKYGRLDVSINIVSGQNTLNVEMIPIVVKGTLNGKVTDSTTGLGISGVAVNLAGVIANTDSNGNYAFYDITPGNYTITFTKSGYQTITR